MKRHLTERELIEYRFKLATEVQMEEIAGHLQDCAQCGERLEQLKRKFAALDLLHEEPKVSEDLVSQVIEQAREPVQARVVAIRKPTWIGAAAAVLLIGLLLLSVPDWKEDRIKKPDSAEKLTRRVEHKGIVPEADIMEVAKRDIEDEFGRPPFAPASAIELVTLPRRDKVQLTIYNSADLTLVRERRNLTLKKGWNWLQFMWANTLIDPTSLSLEPLEQADKIDIQQMD